MLFRRWRAMVSGICDMLMAASKQPHLSLEMSTLAVKTCSRMRLAEDILDRAVEEVEGLPPTSALVIYPYRDFLWRVFMDALPLGVAVYDRTSKIPRVNKVLLEIVGLDSESDVELYLLRNSDVRHYYQLDGKPLPPDQNPIARLARGERMDGLLLKFVNWKKAEYTVLVSGGLADPADPESLLLLTALDVTEMVQLEHSRKDLMQVFSHEIRNPLQVMKGLVDLLRLAYAQNGHPAVTKYLDSMEEQIRRLSHFMDDVGVAYRQTAVAESAGFSHANLCCVVREAVAPYLKDSDGHTLVMSLPEVPVPVMGDFSRLVEMLQNLLDNAMKYSPRGSTVSVSVFVPTGCDSARVRVEDEGAGIPPAELESVFAGFYRPKDLSNWHNNGTGLGLYVSRNIARQHGGDLWAENRPQGGAVMCVRLPLFHVDTPQGRC